MGEIEESGGKNATERNNERTPTGSRHNGRIYTAAKMPPKGTTRIPCGTIDEMGRQKRNRLSPKRNKPRK